MRPSDRPRIKGKYHVEVVGDESVFLLSEREDFVLEGSDLLRILPLFDGERTLEEIQAVASRTLPPERVAAAVEVLVRDGHLAEANPEAPPAADAYWSELDVDTRSVPQAIASRAIQLSVFGVRDASPLRAYLEASGLQVHPSGDIHVAVVDDYERPELAELNRLCLQRGQPLLLVKPVGVCQWIGPLIVPGRTACWKCLEARLRDNRVVEGYVQLRTGRPAPLYSTRSLNGLGEVHAYAAAVTQLLHWLVRGSNPNIESRFLVADCVTFDYSFHEVVRLPDCPACGDGTSHSRAGRPIRLKQSVPAGQEEGGYRSEAPEVTYERLKHHISRLSGIVSHVEKGLWYGHGPIRTYVAGHNFALRNGDLWFLKDGLRTHSSGKGWSDAQARTSALCEAIERHSGVYQGTEPQIEASLSGLGDSGVDPRSAMLFSERQYRDRESWVARGSRFQVVPVPFDATDRISWTPAWSLTRSEVRYLPTSYLYYNFQRDGEPFYCWADSNGAAAGRTLEEAMLQGLLELVERDSVSLWWYNRLRLPGVDLASLGDERIAQMRAFYEHVGRDLWALDLTADLRVPAFVALSRRRTGPSEDIMMGFGAHLDPQVALSRALTELNQFIPSLLDIGPDGVTRYAMGDRDAIAWWTGATLENQPYLAPADDVAPRTQTDFAAASHGDIADMVHELIGRLEAAGMEVIALDQTRPAVDLAVVKMIVPGMRHFWARFAPGRLYDVPVRLGLRSEPIDETELNPTSMFL